MATVLRSRCALARLFVGKTGQILNNSTDLGTKLAPESQLVISRYYSSYQRSPFVEKINQNYEYEVFKNPPEWEYVQRLMPFETIPKVKPKENYPSGWVPPKEDAVNHPYFIPRTKNGELPIYLGITFRGMRHITKIKKIEGDLWVMNDEIKQYLKNIHSKSFVTRVHDFAKFIEIKGDHVNVLKEWALSKGF